MQIYRIADSRHPVWSGTGAMLVGGRFNSPGRPVIYQLVASFDADFVQSGRTNPRRKSMSGTAC
jgi:hypothetical protein